MMRSFSHNCACCDPLSCHKRKRTSGGSYILRCVPISLTAKFPSLKLTNKHKICPSGRMKLYKLPGETQSHGSFSGHDSSVAETHFVEDACTPDFKATMSVETFQSDSPIEVASSASGAPSTS